jgi:hypothetical protein
LLTLNAIGVVTYLKLACPCWIEPELAYVPGASAGDPIVWGLSALPILLLFFVLDFSWGASLGLGYLRRKTAIHPTVWLVPIVWAVAIYIDFSHHGVL